MSRMFTDLHYAVLTHWSEGGTETGFLSVIGMPLPTIALKWSRGCANIRMEDDQEVEVGLTDLIYKNKIKRLEIHHSLFTDDSLVPCTIVEEISAEQHGEHPEIEFRYGRLGGKIAEAQSSPWSEVALERLLVENSAVVCCATCNCFRLSTYQGDEARFGGWCFRDVAAPSLGPLFDPADLDEKALSHTPTVHWCPRWARREQ
jgi:hypothetical protein